MSKWIPTPSRLPEQNKALVWISPSGEEVSGGWRESRLWFLPDGVYVYYEPVFWRYM